MNNIFGYFVIVVALTLSVVAAYYSIIGLTAIFAAAVIPIIIMGSALEVAKITTAIWLHNFSQGASILMKSYLVVATALLMLITSMGIFGFLSKAHIEQNASSNTLVAKIERIDSEVSQQENQIQIANKTILSYTENVSKADNDIESRIQTQEGIIADIRKRAEDDIAIQQSLIDSESVDISSFETELLRLDNKRSELNAAIENDDVRLIQAIIGAKVDGVFGPQTESLVVAYKEKIDSDIAELNASIRTARNEDNPKVDAARLKIEEIQTAASEEISKIQQTISLFSNQLVSITTKDNTDNIRIQNEIIDESNDTIKTLLIEKFDLEAELRQLEVEVGPVKYIAELIYGESNENILEEAVRWVILVIVFVFDPLAIVLVLAGVSLIHREDDHDDTNVDSTPNNKPVMDEPSPLPALDEATQVQPEASENASLEEEKPITPVKRPQKPIGDPNAVSVLGHNKGN